MPDTNSPPLVAVVLSDGDGASAREAAVSAGMLADRSIVLERDAAALRADHPDDLDIMLCDWHDGAATGEALGALGEGWLLVLAASERLEVDDRETARGVLAEATGALGISRPDGALEVRLAPIGTDVLDLVGKPGQQELPGVRMVAAAPAEQATTPVDTASAAVSTSATDHPAGERHLIIVWEAAASATPAIVEDLQKHFVVRSRVGLSWSQAKFGSNLSRFYGQKLPADGEKAQHIGTGPFEAILIEDPAPRYAPQMTSSGVDVVNVNVLAAKNRYRAVTGGGHRIHGSTTAEETVHDTTLLLGVDYEEFFAADAGVEQILEVGEHDLLGAHGFSGVRELFTLLDRTATYIVMRNFEEMPDGVTLTGHDDVDLLVRDRDEVALLLNATRVFDDPWRTHWTVPIAGEDVPFDLRYVGDGYYPTALQEQMLASRTRWNDAMWVPPEVLYFNTLLYHALIHKFGISDDYRARLTEMLDRLVGTRRHTPLGDGELVGLLARWLDAEGLQVTRPFDESVHYHPQVMGLLYQGATRLWPDAKQGASTWR